MFEDFIGSTIWPSTGLILGFFQKFNKLRFGDRSKAAASCLAHNASCKGSKELGSLELNFAA